MFPYIFSIISASLWITGAILFQTGQQRKQAHVFVSGGLIVLLVFICYLWIHNHRPPLLTVGETRLWFSLFVVTAGYFSFLRWDSLHFFWGCIATGCLFLFINLFRPAPYDKVLLPVLNSPWIWAHVLFCIAGYAILGFSCIIALGGLFSREKERDLALADDHIFIGFGFLTIGLILGMIWAKEAWGHYWSWDPKLTLSFFTWLVYLSYLHYRLYRPHKIKIRLSMIIFIYGILLFSWLGFFLLPASRNSIHMF